MSKVYKPLSHFNNMEDLILKAKQERYALLHVNLCNLEWTKAILETANETNSPIIIATTESTAKYIGGFKTISNMVNNLIEELKITVPVVMHLDHGSYDGCYKALEAGFSSIMFDGSKLSFTENVEKTKEFLAITKPAGISLETEVGVVGGKEDGVNMGDGELADVKECHEMSKLGITCLAAGIGNIHGVYPANWKGISLERLKEIQDDTNGLPLVLHGGSGIPKDQIKSAIKLGVAKFNLNTDCLIAFSNSLMDFYTTNAARDPKSKYFDIRVSFKKPMEAVKANIKEMLEVTGSVNKA